MVCRSYINISFYTSILSLKKQSNNKHQQTLEVINFHFHWKTFQVYNLRLNSLASLFPCLTFSPHATRQINQLPPQISFCCFLYSAVYCMKKYGSSYYPSYLWLFIVHIVINSFFQWSCQYFNAENLDLTK